MDNVKIKYCSNCYSEKKEHEYQDNMYGKYKRVFNLNTDTGVGCCTVCGKKDKK